MEQKIKVGLTGPFSDSNFGDYAMLINNIYDLNVKNVTVFTYDKKFLKPLLDNYCADFNVEFVDVKLLDEEKKRTILNKVYGKLNKIVKKISFKKSNNEAIENFTPFDVILDIANVDEIYKAVSQLDVLVVNGGGFLNHFWAERTNVLKKIMAPICIGSQLNKRIVFTANGIGPFDNVRDIYRYFVGYLRNTSFAIRDNAYSRSHLNEIGVPDEKINFIPDDLYLINEQILRMKKQVTHSLGRYIVVEMYSPIKELKKYKEDIIKFAQIVYKNYGVSIYLLPFDFGNYGLNQAEYLHSILPNSEVYNLNKVGFLPIQDAFDIIKNAEMMITMRYHGLVLSLSAETPVICRVKSIEGDNRYSFNKEYGILDVAFKDLQFNELDFLRKDLSATLSHVEQNYEKIIKIQKELYSKEQYKHNKVKLKKLRVDYLNNARNSPKKAEEVRMEGD